MMKRKKVLTSRRHPGRPAPWPPMGNARETTLPNRSEKDD